MKLMILDGNSILNRAFYGLQGPEILSTSKGVYTNAVYGFLKILQRYLDEEVPEYLCVAFDLKSPTFRHKQFDQYKAGRKGMPEELAVQVPIIKEVLDAMNIKRIECEGLEADDLIGCIAHRAEREGLEVIIITGDRDALQLLTPKVRIKIPKTKYGKNSTEEYTVGRFIDQYGIQPSNFIDLKGLMGDQSDNIPGVKGIGEKTALQLIREFETIENLYENLTHVGRESIKTKLEQGRDMAFLSKKLATIQIEISDICLCIDDLKRREYNASKLYDIFKRLEFRTLIEKLNLDRNIVETEKSCINTVNEIENKEEMCAFVKKIQLAKAISIYYLLDKTEQFSTKLISIAIMIYNQEKCEGFYIKSEKIGENLLLNNLKPIFEKAEIKKYGHDTKNLIVYLKNNDINFCGLEFDTMIGGYLLNPTAQSYTVAGLSIEYLNIVLSPVNQVIQKKKELENYKIMAEKLPRFMAECSDAIPKIADRIISELKDKKQISLYYNIEHPLIQVLADMEYWGIKIDTEKLKELSKLIDERISVLSGFIYDTAGEEFNINSPKQLGHILFEKLGLPVIKRNKTGYSTDIEVLEQLSFHHEIVVNLIEYRQMAKLKSTYVEGLKSVINPSTGKIHSSFNQTVTATGRISSTEPNLQNIPIRLEVGREMRKAFVSSSDEFKLADADYSQIELRILAHITDDENMKKAFLNDEDIHTNTALNVFHISKDKITPMLRAKAKAVNFGIVYGIGDFSLAKDLGIQKKEARKYIDEYLNEYEGVKMYMDSVVEKCKTDGYVITLFNRRRYIPQINSRDFRERSAGERIAINTPIQGTAADIIKIAMVNVHNELTEKKLKSRLILQIHDELIVEAYKDELAQVKDILKRCMECAAKLSIPLTADVKCGDSWYEAK